jgi:3-deoxy-D-manno-octulosonic-acid transferase
MSGGTLYSIYRAASTAVGPLLRGYLNRRAKAGKEDPARLSERFGEPGRPRPDGKLIWVHAASVGESISALPLLKAVLDANPDAHAVFTSGTLTSAGILADRLPKQAFHQFVPVDHPTAIARFINHWKPDLVLWVESELWPNALEAVRTAGIPAALVNARLSEKSFQQWRRARGLSSRILSTFQVTLAQTQETAARLAELGSHEVRVTGNLKASAGALPAAPDVLAQIRDMIGNRPVFAAASTHDGEEELLARAYLTLKTSRPDLLLIIAPRHPERGSQIAEKLRGLGLAVSRRGSKVRIVPETNVYLMDTIGELGLLYRSAPFVFVGGSLVQHGGQNPLEAARLGIPVLHGPHIFNFKGEYDEMDAAGAALCVPDCAALGNAVDQWLTAPADAGLAGQRANEVAGRGAGALDAVKMAIGPLLTKAGFHAPA